MVATFILNSEFLGCFFMSAWLQVLLGGAVFWHLQKSLLRKGYPPIQLVAWYYSSGVAFLALVVLPNTTKAMWTLSQTDLVALGYGSA